MKKVYNKNDEKEMKALIGFEPAHKGKIIDLVLVATTYWAIHTDNK